MLDLTHDRWQRLDRLLADALDRPPDERTAYLRAVCGDDPALYREAAALLDRVARAEHDFGESVTDYAAPLLEARAAPALADGTHVGAYRVTGELGRGGMGVVYGAERADGAFEKAVALKLVQRGMDTDADALARFHRERRILAGLDHPGIARLLDAGATDDGRPYLVMESVEGEPITDYADRKGLPVEARLALVREAAEAVAYAHRRLVIHRDLKPSNILVAEDDAGAPRVKLLDFGIARLLDPADDDPTLLPTLRFTPAYAAPEQLCGDPITTATDVYALGVLLYELLTGRRPFDLDGKAFREIVEVVASERPPPPSVATGDAARARRLRGDLDAVVLKALAKAPDARYPTVEGLLDDLRRHRMHLPVQARPATVGYRVRAFVRRHRAGVAAAGLVGLLLLGGVGAVLWQARVAARERDAARLEAATADQVTDFLVALFEGADPTRAAGDTLSAHEVVARGTARLERELAAQPAVRARLYEALGGLYVNLGDYARGDSLLARSVALYEAAYGPDHPEALTALFQLFRTVHARRHDPAALARADRLVERWQEALDAQPVLGPEHAEQMVAVYEYLSIRTPADSAAAAAIERQIALLERALAIQRRAYGDEHLEVARTLFLLGYRLDQSEALPLGRFRRTADEARRAQGRAYVRESVVLCRGMLPEAHGLLVQGLRALAGFMMADERYEEALTFYREVYDRALAVEGPDHLQTNMARISMATVLNALHHYEEAAQMAEAAWRSQAALAGEDDVLALSFRRRLGEVLRNSGAYAEAEPHLLGSYERLRALRGDANSFTQQGARALAMLYEAWGHPTEAEHYRRLVADLPL